MENYESNNDQTNKTDTNPETNHFETDTNFETNNSQATQNNDNFISGSTDDSNSGNTVTPKNSQHNENLGTSIKSQMLMIKNTKVLVLMGLFVALSIVFTRIFQLNISPFNRATLQFIPTIFSSMVLGPWLSGIIGAVSDVVGYFLFPTGGAFFPGFTFSALLSGLIYGFFLYNKPKTLLRIILAVLVVSIIVDLGLNTLWLSILYNKAGITFFFPRAIKTAIMFPIQVVLMQLLWKYIGNRVAL